MKITDLKATTVTVPLEAPLRHRDPARKNWVTTMPEKNYADPKIKMEF